MLKFEPFAQLKLVCQLEEVLLIFVQAIVKVIGMEAAIYGQISDEEWEAIRLSKRERRDHVLEFVRTKMVDSRVCGSCLRWHLLAFETWAMRYRKRKAPPLETSRQHDDGDAVVDGDVDADDDGDDGVDAMARLSQVSTWEPTNGLLMTDVLFPHVSHGFRGQLLPVVAYHVRQRCDVCGRFADQSG